MLNSLQVVVYMPMYDHLKFPANAMMITNEMIKIATFDLIPTDVVFNAVFYFPDNDPFSLNFETVGVESTLFFQNIGFALFVIVLHILMMIIHAAVYKFRNGCSCITKVQNKLGKYLYYNGLLRLYLEAYFDLCLFSILNLHMVNWETEFVSEQLSNYVSVFVAVLVSALPIGLVVFYCRKKEEFHEEEF